VQHQHRLLAVVAGVVGHTANEELPTATAAAAATLVGHTAVAASNNSKVPCKLHLPPAHDGSTKFFSSPSLQLPNLQHAAVNMY
jgi:hypothetical protein